MLLPPGSRPRQAVGRRPALSLLALTTFISVLYWRPPGSRPGPAVGRRPAGCSVARTTSVPCGPPSGGWLWPAAGGRHSPFHTTVHPLTCSHSHITTPAAHLVTSPITSQHLPLPYTSIHRQQRPQPLMGIHLQPCLAAPNLPAALGRTPPPPPGRRGGGAPSWFGLMLGPLWGLGTFKIIESINSQNTM